MSIRTVAAALLLLDLVAGVSVAEDSPQERLRKFKESQARIAELQQRVVAAPDDRKLYRRLLEAGLQQYELITQSRFPDDVRENILDLKLVMEDMYSLQETIREIGSPSRTDGADLVNRLAAKKVPSAHRRSVPLIDPWGTSYRFFVSANGQYKIVSAGSDRKFDPSNLGISAEELRQAPEKRSVKLSDDIVFIDGRNFTSIYDYPKTAQTFLYTRCRPADELQPERYRCW